MASETEAKAALGEARVVLIAAAKVYAGLGETEDNLKQLCLAACHYTRARDALREAMRRASGD